MTDRLDRAVEALIFAADEPLGPAALARVVADVTGAETTEADVEAAVERVNAVYVETDRAFRVHRWGGGYRLATTDEAAPFVKAMFEVQEERRLSRSLLETLAVVAYRQPVSKPEIDFVRGVSSDYALRQLLEREFVTVVGRAESVGRPLLYGTTEAFLDQFGLGTLDELPRPREIEELLADPAFSRERALLFQQMQAHPAEAGDIDAFAAAASDDSVEPSSAEEPDRPAEASASPRLPDTLTDEADRG